MILNHLLEIYALFFLTVFVHELAHWVCAWLIGLNTPEFRVGDELFAIRLGRVSISPNVTFGSYVSFDADALKTKSKRQIILFFLSGVFANAIEILIGVVCLKYNYLYGQIIIWSSIYSIAGSMLPVMPKENDLNKMLRYLKNIGQK